MNVQARKDATARVIAAYKGRRVTGRIVHGVTIEHDVYVPGTIAELLKTMEVYERYELQRTPEYQLFQSAYFALRYPSSSVVSIKEKELNQ